MSLFPSDPEAEFTRAHGIVKRFLPASYDTENITMEVLLESWKNAVFRPSRAFIQNRCIDSIRVQNRERAFRQDLQRQPQWHTPKGVERKDQVEVLVGVLTPLERQLIWFRFYAGLSVRETSKETGMPVVKVRELLAGALFKMREVGDE